MQILMPIASRSQFFPEQEYFFPKPLIEIAGKPMIDCVVSALRSTIADARFCFIISADDARRFSLDETLMIVGGQGTKVIQRVGETKGGLCSALLAGDELDLEAPLVICNSDQIIDAPLMEILEKFRHDDVASGVVTFRSVHPRWCYIVPEGDGRVAQATEKRVVSDIAVAGFYYFRRAGDFFAAARRAILNGDDVEGQYYFSAALNQIILSDEEVAYVKIEASRYYSFYSPEKIAEFAATELAASLRDQSQDERPINVLIPAAGEGSRFARQNWRKPKPFIDVDGRMMLEHVIGNVCPPNATPTVLLRAEHMKACDGDVQLLRAMGTTIRPVDRLTEGTACTVLLARSSFDNDRPLLIANSDQWVDFDCSAFIEDCLQRKLDGSILVFRDAQMDPKWSFAKVDDRGLVTEVAEKKPISDLATVGIYLFRRGSDFVRAAVDMIACNDRVNNEFYTCPAYNYMIRNGARIGVYEVSPDAMKGLGTPEDLNAYLATSGLPSSADAPLAMAS
ncbi:glycosyltransferase family 2 protein [Rhizobium tumorigenes]|uniref:Glycosyltransferase family 2 protein n=1 Tax=Rhizobium tumorigenes TaxID=2041385 RepID=A0AAF1KFJ8_9HYPH|nr:glycosyltransferase family 2 protein [Rhizobium tumorigenes]WFR99106.1 glycosyltransferase family 2 protein [Rhizobium tumorigenes]